MHDIITVNLGLLCIVQFECHIPANKLALQKSNQLIGIELLAACFLKNHGS